MKFIFVFVLFGLFAAHSIPSAQASTKKCRAADHKPFTTVAATVKTLSDGDTIAVQFADRKIGKVRFLSMDTPETHFQGQTQGEPGERAAKRLAELLPVGSRITLDFDETPCDQYGRYLAYVSLDGVDINRQMIEEGLAANLCFAPTFSRCEDYLDAAEEATANGVSLFENEGVEYPHEFRMRTGGKPEAPFVGNRKTKKVRAVKSLEDMEDIEPPLRVFFIERSLVKPPYKVAR